MGNTKKLGRVLCRIGNEGTYSFKRYLSHIEIVRTTYLGEGCELVNKSLKEVLLRVRTFQNCVHKVCF